MKRFRIALIALSLLTGFVVSYFSFFIVSNQQLDPNASHAPNPLCVSLLPIEPNATGQVTAGLPFQQTESYSYFSGCTEPLFATEDIISSWQFYANSAFYTVLIYFATHQLLHIAFNKK